MIRTQIQLTESQSRALQRHARELGVSAAEAIRRAVDAWLTKEQRKPDRSALFREALAVCGQFEDTADDVATNHDRYLVEAYDR